MRRISTLKIIPFTYPSGTVAWRLTGRLLGKIYQMNFPTREEAEVHMSALLRAATQGKSGPATRLAQTIFATDQELQAAELAHMRLKAALPHASLTTAVDFYLAMNTVVVTPIKADEAILKFNARRIARGNEEETTVTTGTVLRKFIGQKRPKKGQPPPPLKIKTTDQITRENVSAFIFDESVKRRTRRDRYDLLHNLFEFLVREKHMLKNLVDDLDRPIYKKQGNATIFALDQCQALLEAAATEPGGRDHPVQGAMLPYFAECMLSGLRPDEAQRLKPDWSNVIFENGVILGFRAKTGEDRQVAMHDQLPGILRQCKAAGLQPGYFKRAVFERIQRKAGVRIPVTLDDGQTEEESLWDNDILRHCYASYAWAREDKPEFLTQHKMGFLMQNMGNSERVLKRSYINGTVLAPAGTAYFQMQPASMGGLGTRVSQTRAKAQAPAPATTEQTASQVFRADGN